MEFAALVRMPDAFAVPMTSDATFCLNDDDWASSMRRAKTELIEYKNGARCTTSYVGVNKALRD